LFNTRDLTWPEIQKELSGRLLQGDCSRPAIGVSTDSRNIQPGNLFIALKGPHFDGRAFVAQALERGAAAALVAGEFPRQDLPSEPAILQVEDTLEALGRLAQAWRRRFSLPLIGLSGSNGKTTTKEMTAAILGGLGPTLKNPGNLNNLIGLPLTLLTLGPEHRSGVLEMGMNRPGEIRRLAEIGDPDLGLLTNIGPAHLEGLGSLEAVARAKGELFEALSARDWAILNRDDEWIMRVSADCMAKKIHFGLDPQAEVRAEGICLTPAGTRFSLRYQGAQREIHLGLWGDHNVRNALGAAAVGLALGISLDRIRQGLETFPPPPQRFQIRPGLRGSQLIDDSYNANPASLKAALQTFQALRQGRSGGLVLGDMLELGEFAVSYHREIGRLVGDLGVDYLVTIGPLAKVLSEEALRGAQPPRQVRHEDSLGEVIESLKKWIGAGDWILIKGSHGMALENVVRALAAEQG
jgi:UDP-N-acetylmuramoyl-tripeptide--D-alanyl-D-alanine ligase